LEDSNGCSGHSLAEGFRETLEEIMGWLGTLAHDMMKWQTENYDETLAHDTMKGRN
jgi:hypothetical protein